MKRLFGWVRDETGAVLSAEAALLGTVGVLGVVVGANLFAKSVNDELRDVAYSFRSLDQSYSVAGHSSPTAWTAGSGYTQEPVDVSLAELRKYEKELRERHGDKDRAEDGGRDDDDRDEARDRKHDRDNDRDDDDDRKRDKEDRDDD
jgi:hypothetical protein